MTVKERLRELRLEKGLSQNALALRTGLSQSAIARWEIGESEPCATAIVILAKFFGESADYLLGLKDE